MSGQWKKDACASFTHNLLLILGLCTTTLFGPVWLVRMCVAHLSWDSM